MEGAVGADVKFAMETFLHHVAQTLAQGRNLYLSDHLVAESVEKHSLCRPLADAAASEVEERVLVELADGRAMGTLHIVVIDL